jgi:hypothetical protein
MGALWIRVKSKQFSFLLIQIPTSHRLTSRGHTIAQRERATAWWIGGSHLRAECVLADTVSGEVGGV